MLPAGTDVIGVLTYPNITCEILLDCYRAPTSHRICPSATALISRYATTSPSPAIFSDIFLGVDPAGPDGVTWLENARSLISGTGFVLAGGETYNYDAVQVPQASLCLSSLLPC